MTTGDSNNFENFRSKINEQLEKVKKEIEELSLQFSLGKSEAENKFENFKKDFHSKLIEWKITGEQIKISGNEKTQALKRKLEELQVQLSLGKSEAKDLFNDQKKKILKKISELEAEMKKKS